MFRELVISAKKLSLTLENENDNGEQQHHNDFIKLYCAILSCPGKVVSLSVLNKQGVFRKTINGKTGKALMAEVTH